MCFGGWKKRCRRQLAPAIPRFSIKMCLFGRRKTQGRVFGAEKKPLREWGHAIPRFSIKTAYFSCRKTQGRVFGGGKSPCGKHADSHPGFGQGPVSNPASPGRAGLEPGLPRVRRPCASPLGNLTTVPLLSRIPWLLGTMDFPQTKS